MSACVAFSDPGIGRIVDGRTVSSVSATTSKICVNSRKQQARLAASVHAAAASASERLGHVSKDLTRTLRTKGLWVGQLPRNARGRGRRWSRVINNIARQVAHFYAVRAEKLHSLARCSAPMSTAAMTVIWFRRKLRQVGEGALRRRERCLPTRLRLHPADRLLWVASPSVATGAPWYSPNRRPW
jgi:hypothetical protein